MKLLFILVPALAAAPVFGETRLTQAAPIALYTQFQEEPSEAVAGALHDELETIMAPMGLSFEWRSLSAVRGNEVAVELAVITFKGKCDIATLLPQASSPGALGWTHVSDGTILPFSDVDCDRIRSFVQKELLAVHPEEREEAFGRALARVLAHELYHIFANTAKHGTCGAGKAAYSVQELLAEDFQFEARESQALRDGKAHEVLENATRTPSME